MFAQRRSYGLRDGDGSSTAGRLRLVKVERTLIPLKAALNAQGVLREVDVAPPKTECFALAEAQYERDLVEGIEAVSPNRC